VLRAVDAPMAIETIEVGPLAPSDVLVRIRAASLCHTDLEVIEGALAMKLPAVLGHEAAGEVAAMGADVRDLAVGDHVVLSWNPHCGSCFYCTRAQPILCRQYLGNGPLGMHFDGRPRLRCDGSEVHQLMYLGSFADYCIVPAQCAVRIPAAMPFDRAALLGCGVMTGVGAATRIAELRWGGCAMVIGCGAVGLSAVQGARLAGAAEIIAVDLNPARLQVAGSVGATRLVDPRAEDAVAVARGLTDGRGADVVLESAGHPDGFRLSVEAVRPGGQVIWLGKVNVNEQVAFRWGSLMQEKRIVRSSYGGARPQQDFPLMAAAYLRGDLRLDEMITARIGLADINDGFAALKRGETIRSVVMFD
jgi:S-(hydroxymethyl)glutathione dehydrogenase/alcohol dehydrogenase